MADIFVTRNIPAAGLKLLSDRAKVVVSPLDRELTPPELIEQTRNCRVLVCSPANLVDTALLDQRPNIRLIANFGAGVDRIDLAAAKARGVVVTNRPGVLSATTANMGITIMLALTRRLIEGDRLLRDGGFKGVHPLFMLGTGTGYRDAGYRDVRGIWIFVFKPLL